MFYLGKKNLKKITKYINSNLQENMINNIKKLLENKKKKLIYSSKLQKNEK